MQYISYDVLIHCLVPYLSFSDKQSIKKCNKHLHSNVIVSKLELWQNINWKEAIDPNDYKGSIRRIYLTNLKFNSRKPTRNECDLFYCMLTGASIAECSEMGKKLQLDNISRSIREKCKELEHSYLSELLKCVSASELLALEKEMELVGSYIEKNAVVFKSTVDRKYTLLKYRNFILACSYLRRDNSFWREFEKINPK